MRTKKIFAICSKSAAGKDTLVKEIKKSIPGIEYAISFTTRPKRQNETNLVEYEFISLDDFKHKQQNGEIAEHIHYNVINENGLPDVWYYGLSMNQLTKGEYVLTIVNPHGLQALLEIPSISDKLVSILIDVPPKDRLIRSLNREDITESKAEEICRRFICDNSDFKDICCDYIIYNDGSLNDSLNQFRNIMKTEIMKG